MLASDIQDHPENQTRFVLVGHGIPAPTGHDKTSWCASSAPTVRDRCWRSCRSSPPARSTSSKLESRPTKRSLGDYCFFIDFEGHVDNELVADCLRNLAAAQAEVKFLGSYPVTGDGSHARRRAVTKARRDAAKWIDDLRAQVRPGSVPERNDRSVPERGIG